ncbi:GNAT family N-acetyltransferase [Planctomycetes bacterium K23_9]|uniref:N-acetyltransferase domain-containing protein n=1 Tax=Stieleria marina TaxID=1930275 RepID=A0A517NU26_9BACT|nr:hypothetical protein K239x_25860 [Planctomycetes bacterium K23_9]
MGSQGNRDAPVNSVVKHLAGLRSRGFLYSVGVVVNRIVPASLFRFRLFSVYELATDCQWQVKSSGDVRSNGDAKNWKLICCRSDEQIREAEQLTFTTVNQDDPSAQHQTPWVVQSERDEIFVAGIWVTQGSFDEIDLGVRLLLPDDSRWLYSAYVDKDFRRRGIYRYLISNVIDRVSDEDAERALVSINPTNRASMAAHRTLLKRKIGTCVAVKMLCFSMCISSRPLSPRIGVTLQNKRRPIGLCCAGVNNVQR